MKVEIPSGYRIVWYKSLGKHQATKNHLVRADELHPRCADIAEASKRIRTSINGKVDCKMCQRQLKNLNAGT